ncbi:MAG TPA: hypothetical protein VF629_03240 [Hymenobacter sp.]|jgi:hypothetical protein|uniref:hypothetical protein n=1 Tax=Hymenobacter sp. TaxID=1898978 RepID=UPI002EDB6419
MLALNQADCIAMRKRASQTLCAFNAPLLSKQFMGHSIYRLLYLRSFHRPALLTLDCTPQGGTLKTQFLNKPPDWIASATELAADTRAAIRSLHEIQNRIRTGKASPGDAERLENAKYRFVQLELIKSPIIITDQKTVHLSQAQVQRFKELLAEATFWQLLGCKATLYFDGADYILESHEAERYHMVKRQSPNKRSGFARCCSFLLDRSSFDFKADKSF